MGRTDHYTEGRPFSSAFLLKALNKNHFPLVQVIQRLHCDEFSLVPVSRKKKNPHLNIKRVYVNQHAEYNQWKK